jgi:tRNA modification GTPase
VFSTADTIVAVATPPGRGGIGIVRVSGPRAHAIACRLIAREKPLKPRYATLATLTAPPDSSPAQFDVSPDRVVVTWFPGPRSYTGDDVVELSAHGSPVVLNGIVRQAVADGARIAAAGEFTLRAFLNGRIDLMQAEAVGDLIAAVTPLQARVAFDQLNGTLTTTIGEIDRSLFDLVARLEASVDFPEESYHFVEAGSLAAEIDALSVRVKRLLQDGRRGRIIREGLQVAIVGAPNVGKSSLFNALLGTSRAIVADVPGTTRDLVTDRLDVGGLEVTLIDTAGLRLTADPVELEGVSRSRGAAGIADLTLVVVDLSEPYDASTEETLQTAENTRVIVGSKADLPARWHRDGVVEVSARTSEGLDGLRARMLEALDLGQSTERPAITNIRHLDLLERAGEALDRARAAASNRGRSMPEEFVLADLQDARAALEEIAGRRSSDDLLAHVFSRFCIGK